MLGCAGEDVTAGFFNFAFYSTGCGLRERQRTINKKAKTFAENKN
jgi:hypothetical protein